jgi:hypothetical protein
VKGIDRRKVMRFDWQSIAVALVVLAALAYVARRAWARLRSMRAGAKSSIDCGSCGNVGGKPRPTAPQATVLVQIGRQRSRPHS